MKKLLLCLFFPYIINAQTAFISGNDTICDNGYPAVVKIDFNGIPPYTFIYDINGVTQVNDSTYTNPYILNTKIGGTYTLVSYNDATSFGSVSGSGVVTILKSPKANIHLESDTLSIINSVANFVSQSTPVDSIISWIWDFGDNTTNKYIANPSHSYNDSPNVYQASLIVTHSNGCLDTAIHNIWVRNEFWIYIPNSFTPDGDLKNDKFCIEYSGIRENTFLFKVFNSQGVLMFQSTNPSEMKCSIGGGWNGKSSDSNRSLPLDTYVYELYFQDFEGWKHKDFGAITNFK